MRLLFEVMTADQGAVFAGQVTEHVALETTQGVRDRLNELADGPFLEVQTVGNRNLYRLTDDGRARLYGKIRECLD